MIFAHGSMAMGELYAGLLQPVLHFESLLPILARLRIRLVSNLGAANPLAQSIEVCRANLRRILERAGNTGVPLGVNVESVSINRDEIDASIDLAHALKEILDQHVGR